MFSDPKKQIEEVSRFCKLLNEEERLETIIDEYKDRKERIFVDGCEELRKQLKHIKGRKEVLDLIHKGELDSQIKMKCCLILAGLTTDEALDLMNDFMEDEAERYVLYKKLTESEGNLPKS